LADFVLGKDVLLTCFAIQILRATLLKPLDATSPLTLRPRLSTTTSPTGGARLTGHEDEDEEREADVDRDVRYCTVTSGSEFSGVKSTQS
jgi:hypothetical protein